MVRRAHRLKPILRFALWWVPAGSIPAWPTARRGWFGLMIEILAAVRCEPATLHEIEELSDAVFMLGEDITNVAPRIALSLRQSVRQQPMEIANKLKIPVWLDHGVRDAVQDQGSPLFIATPVCHAS